MKKIEKIQIKGVIFDFDGTLAHLNINFNDMRNKINKLISAYSLDPDKFKEKYIIEKIEEASKIIPAEKKSFFLKDAENTMISMEIKAAKDSFLFPQTLPVMKKLKAKNILIGVITRNCEQAVLTIFPEIELYSDIFLPRERIKKVKPHPFHLLKVIKKFEIEPKECIMVGDHPMDIVAGKKLGMITVGVLSGSGSFETLKKEGADYIIPDIGDLFQVIP
ncbi:MAG: HAD family hydrolase [Deltaproteobacteria bacterium]|nr:HAD family hydrolase [Deltaproteobacteria bacterium]